MKTIKAGAARTDITPSGPVWMDGMIRSHKSTGVRHRLYAKAMALANGDKPGDLFVFISVDVCGIKRPVYDAIYARISARSGIAPDHIILAATHTHSGPATAGYMNPREEEYIKDLVKLVGQTVEKAVRAMRPALVGCASGAEKTISHYRRLLAKDGRVIMNWEPYKPEEIIGPLGEIDPEVGVLMAVAADKDKKPIAILFNHAGHPNVMSGDNYLLSAEYPGLAESILEKQLGGTAIFVNGAQGTMDIDGLKDRDWGGMDRVANALAGAVGQTINSIKAEANVPLRSASIHYEIPARKVPPKLLAWAEKILAETKGKIKAVADGVGDDYKAKLIKDLHSAEDVPHQADQVCIAVGDTAWLSFPGELFTEIGVRIKKASPFKRTYIVGLANGGIGYIPTRKAIREGGYESDTRKVVDEAEDIIFDKSLALLKRVRALPAG